jgi:hypothetical protein
MKKILFFLMVFGYSLNTVAEAPESSWGHSDYGKLFIKKITIGETSARLWMKDGNRIAVPLEQINSYSAEGRLFKKFPLYINGKLTNKIVFMELIKTQNNLVVYKFSDWSYNPNAKIVCYLIFNGDQLLLEYDEKTCN